MKSENPRNNHESRLKNIENRLENLEKALNSNLPPPLPAHTTPKQPIKEGTRIYANRLNSIRQPFTPKNQQTGIPNEYKSPSVLKGKQQPNLNDSFRRNLFGKSKNALGGGRTKKYRKNKRRSNTIKKR